MTSTYLYYWQIFAAKRAPNVIPFHHHHCFYIISNSQYVRHIKLGMRKWNRRDFSGNCRFLVGTAGSYLGSRVIIYHFIIFVLLL